MASRKSLVGLFIVSGVLGCNTSEPSQSADSRNSARASPTAQPTNNVQNQQGAQSILDYMIMDVCTDSSDRIQTGVIPGDSQCQRRRNIRPGETPPYVLHNFGYPGSRCANSGTIDKTNAPVTRTGVTRIVSTTIRRGDCLAPTKAADLADDATDADGASIQWADDRYGFIMGSYSPVALSAFQSSLCRDNPNSSRRFFRSWVIAPTDLPATRKSGGGVFDGAMVKGASKAIMGACPARYRKGFASWTIQPFTFKSNRKMVAVISSHFAQAAPDGLSPGNAMQMERTYWTSEFGISRWEKWTREDFDRKDGQSVNALASRLVQRGRCSAPQMAAITYSSALAERGANGKDIYALLLTNPRTGESHRWLMTLCEDYSNARLPDANTRRLKADNLASDLYWAP